MSRYTHFEGNYHPRIDQLKSGEASLPALRSAVHNWGIARPSIIIHDQNLDFLSHNIVHEVTEVEDERQKHGTPIYNILAEQTEMGDAFFFPNALAIARGIEFDPHRVLPYLNGFGNRSDIFDKMRDVAGNLTETNVADDLHYYLQYAFAALASVPEHFDLNQVMNEAVVMKNAANYPAQFFNGIHPVTGE